MKNKRSIDVDNLSDDQLEIAITKISNQINKEVDLTCEKANALLSRYGLICKMQILIESATEAKDSQDV